MAEPEEFFRYLPAAAGAAAWGVAVTAAGRARTEPGQAYPPGRHPADHVFTWANGRVLDAYQVVLVVAGGGWFESRATGLVEVEAGTAMMVFPGVWHRYAPRVETGWEECWVELQGATLARLQAAGVIAPERAVVAVERPAALRAVLEAVLARLRAAGRGFDATAAALGLQVVAALHAAEREARPEAAIDRVVTRAERLFAARVDRPPSIPDVARELGVGYSYFRRAFKARTGLSPREYVQRLRLEKAQRLLGSTPDTLEVVAERLGFSSPYHLSTAFKQAFGVSPQVWRRSGRRTDREK